MTDVQGSDLPERNEVLDWLLEPSQPAVHLRTLTNLMDLPAKDPEVRDARAGLRSKGWVKRILDAQGPEGRWGPGGKLYEPKYTANNWRMLVLSDMGITADDPQVRKACNLFFTEWLENEAGFYDGDEEVCIIGNLARMLTRFGYGEEPRVKKMFRWLVDDQKEDGGWHCFESDKGTLDCWEALAAYAALPRAKWNRSMKRSVERGAEFYLSQQLFKEGERYPPWLRFHYPVHYYYDMLVGLGTLCALGYGGDSRMRPALRIMQGKMREDGKWVLDSAHPDLGPGANYSLRKPARPFLLERVGSPSKWITLNCLEVLKSTT